MYTCLLRACGIMFRWCLAGTCEGRQCRKPCSRGGDLMTRPHPLPTGFALTTPPATAGDGRPSTCLVVSHGARMHGIRVEDYLLVVSLHQNAFLTRSGARRNLRILIFMFYPRSVSFFWARPQERASTITAFAWSAATAVVGDRCIHPPVVIP